MVIAILNILYVSVLLMLQEISKLSSEVFSKSKMPLDTFIQLSFPEVIIKFHQWEFKQLKFQTSLYLSNRNLAPSLLKAHYNF